MKYTKFEIKTQLSCHVYNALSVVWYKIRLLLRNFIARPRGTWSFTQGPEATWHEKRPRNDDIHIPLDI